MTDDDTALLEELRDMWVTYDPPPPALTATMIAAVAAADLDEEWELLVLLRDSTESARPVRGLSTARLLHFTAAEGWSLEAEIDGDQVRGQLLDHDGDMESVEVSLETRDGASWATTLDEVGFFAMRAEPTGSVRFTVRVGDRVATSRWLDV